MNKGLRLASGDIICFLNSDDIYSGDHSINRVVDAFMKYPVRMVWGDLNYVYPGNTEKIFRIWKSGILNLAKLKIGKIPPHPSFFIRKSIVTDVGFFDTNIDLAADFDYMKRCLLVDDFTAHHIPEALVKMRIGGASNESYRSIYNQNIEIIASLKASFPEFSVLKFIGYKVALKFFERVRGVISRL